MPFDHYSTNSTILEKPLRYTTHSTILEKPLRYSTNRIVPDEGRVHARRDLDAALEDRQRERAGALVLVPKERAGALYGTGRGSLRKSDGQLVGT